MSASISSDDEHLQSATCGFDFLFSNDIADAKTHFADKNDPFHLLGAGVVAFVEAALGMEPGLVTEASALLALAEAGARKQLKSPKPRSNAHRFSPGLEFDILMADAVVLLGLAHALSESYMGYLQCMYSLNNAHSKFTKLYKTVFPHGLAAYKTPGATPTLSRKPSNFSIRSAASAPPGDGTSPISASLSPSTTKSFFARWTGGSPGSPTLTVPDANALRLREAAKLRQDGPMEDLIVAGTAFGFGLFNLVFSLLPKKIQSLVGFFGFKHDRQLALQALAVSATRKDVHSIFAGLVLMTYHGVVLLLSGYQADEAHILKQYKAIVDSIEDRYPSGALWILNRAKILRMSYDAEGAIKVLRQGLKPERPHTFAQADGLLVFELAWTLLGQMQYQEAAEMFLRITELNNWSHATYYFLAAGCYVSLDNAVKAQQLLNTIPGLMDKRKIGGKDLPTEVFIKKKLEFYKDKQGRRGGNIEDYAQSMRISVAEELGIFWNTHARIERRLALAHIQEWSSLTPPLSGPLSTAAVAPDPSSQSKTITIAPGNPNSLPDLDTPDEHALRALLLGISHRTAGNYDVAKTCFKEAYEKQSEICTSTWIPGVAIFEMAVLELKVVEAGHSQSEIRATSEGGDGAEVIHSEEAVVDVDRWEEALSSAEKKLDAASALASAGVDLSSRLGSRIEMLRDEIKVKRGMLGGVQLQL